MEKLKKAKDGNDVNEITKAMDDLSSSISKIGAQMYQQAQSQGVSDQKSSEESDKKTVEGEYEEVKEDKGNS